MKSCCMLRDGKSPFVVKENGLADHISGVFLHGTPPSKSGKYFAKTGVGYEMIHPTPQAAPKSLDTGGFFGPNFPRVSALFYAYNPASVFAGQ